MVSSSFAISTLAKWLQSGARKKKGLKSVRPNDHHSSYMIKICDSHFSFFMIMLFIIRNFATNQTSIHQLERVSRSISKFSHASTLKEPEKLQDSTDFLTCTFCWRFSQADSTLTPSCGHSFHLFPSLLHVLPLAAGNTNRLMIICKDLTNCKRLAWFLSHHNNA